MRCFDVKYWCDVALKNGNAKVGTKAPSRLGVRMKEKKCKNLELRRIHRETLIMYAVKFKHVNHP